MGFIKVAFVVLVSINIILKDQLINYSHLSY